MKQGIPVYDHYKMFKNRNYNNASQKRLAKFALIKYRINFRNYGITYPTPLVSALFCSSIPTICSFKKMFFVLVYLILDSLAIIVQDFLEGRKRVTCSQNQPSVVYTALALLFTLLPI